MRVIPFLIASTLFVPEAQASCDTGTIQQQFQCVKNRLDLMTSIVQTLQTECAARDGDIDTLQADVALATTDIATNRSDIAALQVNDSDQDVAIDGLTSRQGSNTLRLDAIEADYLVSADVADMATRTWVQSQGYATESWVQSQGYSTEAVEYLSQYLTVDPLTDSVVLTGANLFVQNGAGSTYDTENGLGNLIVGYDDHTAPYDVDPLGSPDSVAGSHNIVVGDGHSYAASGSIVAGFDNAVLVKQASALGGERNLAMGQASAVISGVANVTSGPGTAVLGGDRNEASSSWAVVVGGMLNLASRDHAVAVGGNGNDVDGYRSVIIAGRYNHAPSTESVVVGGDANSTGEGPRNVIVGGDNNTVFAGHETVHVGGKMLATIGYHEVGGLP